MSPVAWHMTGLFFFCDWSMNVTFVSPTPYSTMFDCFKILSFSPSITAGVPNEC